MGDVCADVVVVDNESRDGTGDIVATEFPRARVVRSRESRLRLREQPRADDLRRPLRAVPQSRHRDPRRYLRGAGPRDGRPPRVGLVGARQVNGEGRLDMTIRRFPNALRALGEALSAERFPGAALARRARARPGRVRPRGRVRLDQRVVHARAPRGDRERRLLGRALLHVLRGDRLLPAHQDAPDGRCATSRSMTILHHGAKARHQAEHREPERLHAHRVCAQALLPAHRALYTPQSSSATCCGPSTRGAASWADIAEQPTGRR